MESKVAVAFAAVALITAGLAYLLFADTGQQAAYEDLSELAVGRTVGLADEIGKPPTFRWGVVYAYG